MSRSGGLCGFAVRFLTTISVRLFPVISRNHGMSMDASTCQTDDSALRQGRWAACLLGRQGRTARTANTSDPSAGVDLPLLQGRAAMI